VEEQKKLEATLAVEVESARVRISEIQAELESVIEQLGEAKVSPSKLYYFPVIFKGNILLAFSSVNFPYVIFLVFLPAFYSFRT